MKLYFKIIVPLILVVFGSHTFASEGENYYMYKGNKVSIDIDSEIKYFVFSSSFRLSDLDKLESKFKVVAFGNENVANTLLPISENESSQNWAIIESAEGDWGSEILNKSDYQDFCYRDESGVLIAVTNMFFVKLQEENSFNELNSLAIKHSFEIIGRNKYMPLWYTIKLNKNSKQSTLGKIKDLQGSSFFSALEPDIRMPSQMNCVNDPLFPSQWGHNNIKSCSGWNFTMGSPNILIAVVDEGIFSHSDLVSNISSNSFDPPSGSNTCHTYGDHGTHVAGIIAAEGNNNIGVVGVAPSCQLMCVSVEFGYGNTNQYLADGINFAWQNNADIINNSWGGAPSQIIDDAVDDAINLGRGGLGCVVVFASGNDGIGSVSPPGNSNSDIIVVGSTDNANLRSNYSNYGAKLDVVAPGEGILSTGLDNSYIYKGGTSMAAPQVVGLAGLILSLNPCLTMEEVTEVICRSTQKVSASYNQNKDYGTWNTEYGYGLINVEAALKMVLNNYYQNFTETATVLHNHVGNIRAGRNVTNSTAVNDYIVGWGAKVEFKATESISLEAGFEVDPAAEFFAQVKPQTEDCGDWNAIFHKKGNSSSSEYTFSTLTNTNTKEATFYNVKLYPNPFQDRVNFEFELGADEPVIISIYNTLGYRIYSNKFDGKKGKNSSIIDVLSQDKILIIELTGKNDSYRKVLLKD